ncbi:MAG: hypothetical protein ABI151_13825, partial [Chitinophagaceae bacterium]
MNGSEKHRLNQLFAGAAKTEITPPLGTFVNGDFVSHYAQWIHDPLYAKALVLQYNEIIVAIVVVDICVMPKEFIDEVKLLIHQESGIAGENVLISSTHTHAAGSIASVYLSASDLMYTRKLPALLSNAVSEAKKKLRPAKVGFGSVDVPEHVRCRRYYMQDDYQPMNPITGDFDKVKTNPFGKENLIIKSESAPDPEVSFLAVQGLDGQWISLLANYSLHYVGDWENGTISADYFGFFSSAIKQKLNAGDDFVGIMSNGTSGDINIWDFMGESHYPTGNFEKSAFIGLDIAEKIFRAVINIEWENEPSLQVKYEELIIAIRKPDINALENAKQTVAASRYENMEIDEAGLKGLYAREQVLLNELPGTLDFPIQAIRIGTGIIGALGAEIFAETGLWLKANAPTRKYFSIGLANASCGYLPPAHEFKLGG